MNKSSNTTKTVTTIVTLVVSAAIAVALVSTSTYTQDAVYEPATTTHETTNTHETTKPDWTYPACSVYADSSTPVLPPYTHKVGCVTDNGTLSFPNK